MNNILKILDDDIPVINSTNTSIVPSTVLSSNVLSQANNTIQEDAIQARGNIRLLIEQGAQAIHTMTLMSGASLSPRSFEVLATLLKTVSELNHDLLKVHETEQALTGESGGGETEIHNHIEKAVFVGSTTELQEMMKQQKAILNEQHNKETEEAIETQVEEVNADTSHNTQT